VAVADVLPRAGPADVERVVLLGRQQHGRERRGAFCCGACGPGARGLRPLAAGRAACAAPGRWPGLVPDAGRLLLRAVLTAGVARWLPPRRAPARPAAAAGAAACLGSCSCWPPAPAASGGTCSRWPRLSELGTGGVAAGSTRAVFDLTSVRGRRDRRDAAPGAATASRRPGCARSPGTRTSCTRTGCGPARCRCSRRGRSW
jgi:hypothetical protein